jgi:acyl transferase domain-containing protein
MGSVKTNIGHMESAAGIASIIKTALVLSRREVPPNLHFQTPNPAIPFESLNLRVPTEMLPLPEEDAPLLASVNSFGFGGANAHAILEAAPEPDGKCISTGSSTGPEVEQRLPARILRLSPRVRSHWSNWPRPIANGSQPILNNSMPSAGRQPCTAAGIVIPRPFWGRCR